MWIVFVNFVVLCWCLCGGGVWFGCVVIGVVIEIWWVDCVCVDDGVVNGLVDVIGC